MVMDLLGRKMPLGAHEANMGLDLCQGVFTSHLRISVEWAPGSSQAGREGQLSMGISQVWRGGDATQFKPVQTSGDLTICLHRDTWVCPIHVAAIQLQKNRGEERLLIRRMNGFIFPWKFQCFHSFSPPKATLGEEVNEFCSMQFCFYGGNTSVSALEVFCKIMVDLPNFVYWRKKPCESI